MENKKNCSRCRFFFGDKKFGECRRFPPCIKGITGAEYPEVSQYTNVCGEFVVDGNKTAIVEGICSQTCFHYKNGRCKKADGVCDVYRERIKNKQADL